MDAVVVTPTVGEPELAGAAESVARQSVPARHLIVVDGKQHEAKVREILRNSVGEHRVDLLVLPRPTGVGGYFGHRAVAAAAFTVLEDVILLLDADNTYAVDHISSVLHALSASQADWCYSLREFIGPAGEHLLPDDCESLGYWPRVMYFTSRRGWHSLEERRFMARYPHLVDTSCFGVRRPVFVRHAAAWDFGHGADALFAHRLIEQEIGVGTGLTTVSYRLSDEKRATLEPHFRRGNDVMAEILSGHRPWRDRDRDGVVRPPNCIGISAGPA
jgi:hypothetical protein